MSERFSREMSFYLYKHKPEKIPEYATVVRYSYYKKKY